MKLDSGEVIRAYAFASGGDSGEVVLLDGKALYGQWERKRFIARRRVGD